MKTIIAIAAAAGALFAQNAMAADAAKLAQTKGCLACHQVDKKVVGPSYKDVAKKYAGQADAADKLATKIQKGGSGTWGTVPMPPNNVTPAEAKELATWVLSQK